MSRDSIQHVLSHYAGLLGRGDCDSLANAGGFSGATFWRIRHGSQTYCLRRWPHEHPSRSRLSFIHHVLKHAAKAGIEFVPVPLNTSSGETFVHLEGHFWELSPWLAGEANYASNPSPEKLRAALAALALFHNAAGTLGDPRPSRSLGISERHRRLAELLDGGADRIRQTLSKAANTELSSIGQRIVERFSQRGHRTLNIVSAVLPQLVRQQPCIRDVWHDHVLFVENRVTGIVDFGAMRTETVAADIARLLGSLAKDDHDQWRTGLAAYESVRPLDNAERQLLRAFDETTVLLSGMNWLQWIYVESRQFDGMDRILARLRETLARLEHLTESPAASELIWHE